MTRQTVTPTLGELLDGLISEPSEDVHVLVTFFPFRRADYWFGSHLCQPRIERQETSCVRCIFPGGLFTRLAAILNGAGGIANTVGMIGHTFPEEPPGAMRHRARLLRSEGLWPAPGSGVRHAWISSAHVTNLLLATLHYGPVGLCDAVKAVRCFRGLPAICHGRVIEVAA